MRAVDRERRSSSSHTSSPSTLVPSMLSSDAKPNVSEKESGMPEYGSAGGVGEAWTAVVITSAISRPSASATASTAVSRGARRTV